MFKFFKNLKKKRESRWFFFSKSRSQLSLPIGARAYFVDWLLESRFLNPKRMEERRRRAAAANGQCSSTNISFGDNVFGHQPLDYASFIRTRSILWWESHSKKKTHQVKEGPLLTTITTTTNTRKPFVAEHDPSEQKRMVQLSTGTRFLYYFRLSLSKTHGSVCRFIGFRNSFFASLVIYFFPPFVFLLRLRYFIYFFYSKRTE